MSVFKRLKVFFFKSSKIFVLYNIYSKILPYKKPQIYLISLMYSKYSVPDTTWAVHVHYRSKSLLYSTLFSIHHFLFPFPQFSGGLVLYMIRTNYIIIPLLIRVNIYSKSISLLYPKSLRNVVCSFPFFDDLQPINNIHPWFN